jgi:hypothetical protein
MGWANTDGYQVILSMGYSYGSVYSSAKEAFFLHPMVGRKDHHDALGVPSIDLHCG